MWWTDILTMEMCTLSRRGGFFRGVEKYAKRTHEAHHVQDVYYYMINGFHKPDFIIDIFYIYDKKIEVLQAYQSQFVKSEITVETPLVNGYIETVEARERMFGKEVGVICGRIYDQKSHFSLISIC